MRYIDKTLNRCAPFDAYIAREAPVHWDDFHSDAKLELHQHLLEEQQYLCIYCQQSIPPKPIKDTLASKHPSHIEHIRPKDTAQYPHLTFEYNNLAVSCNGFEIDPTLPPGHPEFCGHQKQNLYDETLFLHPFEEVRVAECFEYDLNGKIRPSSILPGAANYTIATLGLDKPVLEEARVEQYLLIIEEVSNNGLDIHQYLDSSQAQLPKFYSMLKQMFGLP